MPPELATAGSAFLSALVSGGDERSALDASGRNRYFLPARQDGPLFSRGSCTCGFLTADATPPVRALFDRVERGGQTAASVREHQRERLRDLLGLEPGDEVVFAPSGTDLCYLPHLLASAARPGTAPRVLLTSAGELGSGSASAYRGVLHSSSTQVAAGLPRGSVLRRRPNDVRAVPARGAGGEAVDPAPALREFLAGGGHRVVQLVSSSKSGLRDADWLRQEARAAGATVVVDLCQMRDGLERAAKLVREGCLVMITGSKFFQAPPFCGAMLVPAALAGELARVPAADLSGWDLVFAAADFPPAWRGIRAALRAVDNLGLSLRWEAALFEMERYGTLGEEVLCGLAAGWHATVVDAIVADGEHFELMPDAGSDPTIVSFRCRAAGRALTHDELRSLHARFVTAPQTVPGFDFTSIGQAVEYPGGSFLRLSLGANDIHRLVAGTETLDHDLVLLGGLAAALGRAC